LETVVSSKEYHMAVKQSPEARRQAILGAAVGVFAQHGFAEATTDALARAAGLSKGGLYWHFKSKDDILAALLDQFFDQELAALAAATAAGESASERLRQLGTQTAADMEQLEPIRPVVLEFYVLAARQAEVRQQIDRYYQHYHRLLTALLEQGFTSGEFHRSTAAQTALVLIAQFEGLALIWSIAPHLVDLRAQTATAIDLVLRALICPPESG
jgi:AcrR family transcriptional regulator